MILNKSFKVYLKSDFFRKVISGSFWLAAGSVLSKILLALAYIILARMLTAKEYGEYGILKSTIDNFLIFATLGVGLTTTKFISEYKHHNPQRASGILGTAIGVVFLLGLFLAGFIFFNSDIIADKMLNSEKLKPLLGVVAVILVFTAVNGVQLGALLGLQSFKQTAVANILQGILLFTGIVLGGYLGGVKGAIYGNLTALILLFFSTQYILRSQLRNYGMNATIKTWRSDLRSIYKFALPASLSTLVTAPTIWYLNTMLARTENGYKELGIYSAAIVFTSAIQMINGTISNVLLPIFLSKETQITPKKEFFNYFGAWLLAIVFSIPVMVFPEITGIIFGKQYDPEVLVKVFGLGLIATLIISNKQGVSRDLIIHNKMWLSVFSMLQWGITSVFLFSFLVDYGALGLATSFTVSYIINLVIFIPVFIRLKITPPFVFYNRYVILIWLSVILLILINVFGGLMHRFFSIVVIGIILISFKKLFKNVVKN